LNLHDRQTQSVVISFIPANAIEEVISGYNFAPATIEVSYRQIYRTNLSFLTFRSYPIASPSSSPKYQPVFFLSTFQNTTQ